jgi:hypothetical protein
MFAAAAAYPDRSSRKRNEPNGHCISPSMPIATRLSKACRNSLRPCHGGCSRDRSGVRSPTVRCSSNIPPCGAKKKDNESDGEQHRRKGVLRRLRGQPLQVAPRAFLNLLVCVADRSHCRRKGPGEAPHRGPLPVGEERERSVAAPPAIASLLPGGLSRIALSPYLLVCLKYLRSGGA